MDKTIHVPVDLHEALKVKAAQQRVTLATLVQRVLRAVVDPPHTTSTIVSAREFVQADHEPAPTRELVYDKRDSQVRRR